MQTLPESFAFVDVETTGGNALYSRVIELAIYRVDNGVLTDSLVTLLDPDTGVPPEITNLTGISKKDIESAPHFRDIADQVIELLDGAVFVAHQARFDYAFVRSELKRLGVPFSRPTLCTAKLFRKLIVGLRHYNLDSLMEYYDIECEQRHRAGPDAKVLVEFFTKAPIMHGPGFWEAVTSVSSRPAWPERLGHIRPEMFPEQPGVYIFKGDTDIPIYIGKSTNVRERILSHFANDLEPKELKLSQLVTDIDVIPTAGEMGALLLESQMIKKYLPLMNRRLRQGYGLLFGQEIEKDGYKSIELIEGNILDEVDPKTLLGVFKSRKAALTAIRSLAETYKLCPQVLGLESGHGTCFWRHIGKCDGACDKSVPAWKHNAQFIEAFSKLRVKQWPFSGSIEFKEEVEGIKSSWIIDNWTIVKHTTSAPDGNLWEHEFTPRFDWDTYQILRKFLLSDKTKPAQLQIM